MRRAKHAPLVAIRASVTPEDAAAFRDIFPAYGASQWVMSLALHNFIEHLRQDKDLTNHVRAAIRAYVATSTEPDNFVLFGARVPTQDYDALNKYLPERGTVTWFIRWFLAEWLASAELYPTIQRQTADNVARVLSHAQPIPAHASSQHSTLP